MNDDNNRDNQRDQDPGKPDQTPPPQPPQRFSRSLLGWVIIIAVGLMLFTMFGSGFEQRKEIPTADFWNYVENGQVTGKIIVSPDRIEGALSDDVPALGEEKTRKFFVTYDYTAEDNFRQKLDTALEKHNFPAKAYYEKESWWQSLLPHLLLTFVVFLAIWFLLFRRLGAAASGGGFLGSFGRSRHRVMNKEHVKVTFKDVAGIEDAKEEVSETIEFLKNPRKFQRLGGRVPRGVLLIGEPGCGKTLLAKAIAGEADVPFFSISGSDFVEMFVGVGASRVRDLFKQAKANSPCIIFLDEIDAVGRRRGLGFTSGGHDEREQTLNAILVEMDGFESSDQVIVISATNRPDVLDPALTRPGRFDRQINVPLPDLQGRYDILNIYADKVKCGPDVDLHRMARGTPMFSGADLAALVNEAAIAATMSGKDYIEQEDLEEARDKVRWGRSRKSRVIDENEKKTTAYHEAGHALVQVLNPDADPLHKVSIIPRGAAGGATFTLPEKDRYLYTLKYCKALLEVSLGGRASEEIFCNDISSGAQNDIAQATEIAKKMVLDWGMSRQAGMVNYAGDKTSNVPMEYFGNKYSEHTAELIDKEIKSLIDEAYTGAKQKIQENRDRLDTIAKALLKYETISAEDVQQIIDGKTLDRPTVDELLEKERAKGADNQTESAPQTPHIPRTPPDTLPEPG